MKEQLLQRLHELKAEFDAGQKTLAELDAKQANLRSTLMRISGAIQVLEEVLSSNGMQSESIIDENTENAHKTCVK